MSLHVLANHMSTKGRNGDSMLVHMTPNEVQGLQALAMKHGGSLTINPDTGLPEANFLKSLLPMIAGLALAPLTAGTSLAFLGATPLASAMTVGGITGLATGSLKKGLMAGLGAYGGASLGAGLAEAGTSTIGATEAAKGLTMTPELAGELQIAGAGAKDTLLQQQVTDKMAAATPYEKLASGFDAFKNNPMGMTKSLAVPLSMAAAPIAADMMVPTTTKSAPLQSPGRIREKIWDGRQFIDVGNTDASVYNTSGRSFSDLYRGYQGGGIVALADGGMPVRMANGIPPKMLTDEQLYQQTGSWDAAAAARDAQNNAMNKATWEQQAQQQKAMDMFRNETAPNLAAQNYVQSITPDMTGTDFVAGANKAGIGLSAPLAAALSNSGLSAGAQYALTHPNEVNGLPGLNQNILKGFATPNLTQEQIDAEQKKYDISDADIQRPFADGYQVDPNQTATARQYLADNPDVARYLTSAEGQAYLKANPQFDASDIAYTHYMRYGKGEGRDWKLPTPVTESTSLPGGIGGVNAIVNPNGTVTQGSAIPGATSIDPTTGATVNNLQDVTGLKNLYTTGGGSLGYTSPVPTSLADFNKTYVTDRMSGDSLAAYEYLTGKKGAAYPTKSTVGQIARPYDEAVLGYPTRTNLPYIYNKTTGKMDVNPDYVAPRRDDKGNVTYSMSANDIKKVLADTPLSGQALYDWAIKNSVSAQQIADATGQSLSQVYAQFRAGSKAKADADKKKTDDDAAAAVVSNQNDGGGGGDARGGLMPNHTYHMAMGGATGYALGGLGTLGGYSDGGRLLKGPGDGVSDSIPATIGAKQQPARLADGEFVVPARIVSELGNGSTEAGARKLYAMMDRVQRARGKTTGKNKVAANSRADKYLPA